MTAYLTMARVCWNSSGAGSLLPRTSSASLSLPAHPGHDAAVAAGICRHPPGRIILRPVQPRRRTRALPLRSRLRLAKFIQLRHESLILSLNLGALLTLAQVLSISGSMPSSPGQSRAKKSAKDLLDRQVLIGSPQSISPFLERITRPHFLRPKINKCRPQPVFSGVA